VVDFVDVLELGQDLNVIDHTNFTRTFVNGDSFTYTSILADQEEEELPRVLQLNIVGINSQNQPVVNFYAIVFTNDCSAYPVISPGNSAGWTLFVSCPWVFYRTLTFNFSLLTALCFILDLSFSSAKQLVPGCSYNICTNFGPNG
jgi:hypothetical protein